LLDPLLDQDEAMVNWRRSIASLTEDLAENGGGLDENTDKGLDNRDMIRKRVEDLKKSAEADFKATGNAEEFADKMERGAEIILEAGAAAEISEGKMRDYLDELGLTPEQIDTAIVTETEQAMSDLQLVKDALDGIEGNWVANILQTTTKRTVFGDDRGNAARAPGSATGGYISGPGTSTSDSIPAMLSDGEYVVRASSTRDNLALLEAINAGKYASGGQVKAKAFANGGYATRGATLPAPSATLAATLFPDQFAIQITNWETGEGRMVAIARGAVSGAARDTAGRRTTTGLRR